ncbi:MULTISPECIES: universal stress protein [Haloarcula]|uniref:universal stress protein n=1 Tax=Haloarcula TaxID=2237 RepID=UPI0023EB51E0|nr:universal stress protein [Halomicroarcula sp. XH51]
MSLEKVVVSVEKADREHLETLVAEAIDVVESSEATVYLQYLFEEEEFERMVDQIDPDAGSAVAADDVAARQESVKAPADMLDAHGVDYEISGVAGGRPAEQIIRRVEELDADLLVVGGSERSPAGKAMFGDYAQQVLLNAPCPVLYIKRE